MEPSKMRILSWKFSELLRDLLGSDKIREIVRLNRAETVKGVCHTHDFCDANQVMLDALEALKFPIDDNGLINEAWSDANHNRFWTPSYDESPMVERMRKNVGKTATLHHAAPRSPEKVAVIDVRQVYGRLQYAVSPKAGTYAKWVSAQRVSIHD